MPEAEFAAYWAGIVQEIDKGFAWPVRPGDEHDFNLLKKKKLQRVSCVRLREMSSSCQEGYSEVSYVSGPLLFLQNAPISL